MESYSCTREILCVYVGFDPGFSFYVSPLAVAVFFFAVVVFIVRWFCGGFRREFEINEAEFGIGSHKIRVKPNHVDRQVAYKIWVELSTRKIGIPIDVEDDVVAEVYDSWYGFFSVTRELIKDVPISKFRNSETRKIIKLSIDVLNEGVRPHLTKWQARFRHWYNAAVDDPENRELSPQQIQMKFMAFDELSADLMRVNLALINYKNKLYELLAS